MGQLDFVWIVRARGSNAENGSSCADFDIINSYRIVYYRSNFH